MKKYFGLLKTSKRFRIYALLGLLSWVILLMLAAFFINRDVNNIVSNETEKLLHHYEIEFEKNDHHILLIEAYFSEHALSMDQEEFSNLLENIGSDEVIQYIVLDHSAQAQFVHPIEDYDDLITINTMDISNPYQRNELTEAILSKKLLYQYEIVDDRVESFYLRKALFIDEEFYGFITIALDPYYLSSDDVQFKSDFIDSALFTNEGDIISGTGVLKDYELQELTVGETTIKIGGRVDYSFAIILSLQYFAFVVIVSLVMLISGIYIYKDTDKIKVLSTDLDYRKNFDSETELFNIERLYDDVAEQTKQKDKFFLAFINVVNLKHINEKFGHYKTTELLRKTTGLIQRVLRNNSEMYRYGGDEYVISIKSDSKSEITNMMRRISNIFETDISSGNIRARLGITVGIVSYPRDGKTVEELVMNAHLTSMQISRYDKEVFKYYEADKIKHASTNEDFDKMVGGLNLELFEVFLMPIVDVQTNIISGFECLTRAFDDFGNTLPTEEVVLSLERNGKIQILDEIVFKKMLQIMRRLNKEYPEEDYFLSLNASALSINDEYVHNITTAYNQARLTKGQIVLELTESHQVEDDEYLITLFNKLNDKGIKVAIDDFGTGYSSLSYISKFPLYAIKIDKSFVRDYTTNTFNQTLLMTLKSIAKVLKCKLVAEGVDSVETLDYLKEFDCPFYQGYLFSKGVPLEDAFALIKNNISKQKE